ncbi:MAG: RNA-binding protein [Taibaiella sp.]|nr:RNA-binding protein [Taibaiella sp.]
MVKVGRYNTLTVLKEVNFGMYLDGDGDEILLPKRYVTPGLKPGDEIEVFIYHDNDQRLVATTAKPVGQVGEIVMMETVSTTPHGAFMKWGIMKDVFVPVSQMSSRMEPGQRYFVLLFIDEKTGRVTGTEKIDRFLSNNDLTVKENDTVQLVVYSKTDLGYKVIINSKHLGLLHFNEMFRQLKVGDKLDGFIKHVRPDNKIDVSPGTRGYEKVSAEEEKILSLLKENDGYLPYNDKSDPDVIYNIFGVSKKTFKMTIGGLYKKRQISFSQTGIILGDESAGE